MCGIAGVIALDEELGPDDLAAGRLMTSLLWHRGPDATSDLHDTRCFLGNTRLKIIDLTDSGNLPMANDRGDVWLAYNGEVTNFLELKKEFRLGEKYRFRSTSDTEVVLRLYEELGIDFLQHLSGMFAFAIYDQRLRRVFVVRDPFGLRPLFSMRRGNRLYFSSEIKSFVDLPGFSKTINLEAIHHYFSLVYIPGVMTPFAAVDEVDGGHLIDIDLVHGTVEMREYYPITYRTNHDMTLPEAIEGFRAVMLDSLERNLISDAPLGLTLSGGIDTSSLLGMAKHLGRSRDLHTFSIRMSEPSFDESRFQRIMVDHAQPIHHEITVRPSDVLDSMIEQMAFMDEPSGNGAVIPSLLLAREAKKYVKVLLSGEGGDEITNGYDTHLALKIRKLYNRSLPGPVRGALYRLAHALPVSMRKLSFDFLAKRFTEGAGKGIAEAHLYWRHVFTEREKKGLLRPALHGFPRTDSLFADLFRRLGDLDDLDKISVIDWKYFFIGDLMVKNDRTFMANSVEARFPFVDRKVVEFAASIPPEYRIRRFTARYVEKEAMRPFLPDPIYRRKSMGLEMPHALWFFQGLEPLIDRYFARKNIEKYEIFEPDFVVGLWQEHRARKKDNGRPIWSILNYMIWHDLFVDGSGFRCYLPRPAVRPSAP